MQSYNKLYVNGFLEIDTEGKSAFLLLYFADGNATGASYAHLDHNTQRNEILQDREGRPESVHLFISLSPVPNNQLRYICILENSSKLNRQKVQSYLNALIKKIKATTGNRDFKATTPDGAKQANGKERTYTYGNNFQMQGHPSSDFQRMLEDGKLSGIVLETHQQEHFAFGEQPHVNPKRQELFLHPVSGKWSERAIEKLKDAIALGKKHNYETARIIFNAPDGKGHTARIDTKTGNIIGEKFIKSHRLNDFSTFLLDAQEQLHSEIKTKILSFFKDL